MQVTAAQIAALVDATVEGDPDVVITGPAKIEEAGSGTITFYGNPAYERFLYTTEASAVLVPKDFQPREPLRPTLLRVDDVYFTISTLLAHYQSQAGAVSKTVSTHAIVEGSATLGKDIRIGKLSIVSEGATIGDGTIVHDQVFVGPRVKIGRHCVLYPGVRILADCELGDNCVVHSNAVIGGDGFGFAPDPETGRYQKIPQVGNVVLEDDVEVGANTTIDRASIGSTIIRRGVKLDNLIQVAHNVEIKENTVIAALTGIAGSAKVGANCRIGGQVGISGHITVADGTQVQAQTGITNNVRQDNQALAGTPFMPWRDFTKSAAAFKMLPAFIKDVRKRLRALEE